MDLLTLQLASALRQILPLAADGDAVATQSATDALSAFDAAAAGGAAVVVDRIRVLVGAQHTYACLEGPGYSADLVLARGRGAARSLRESAVEYEDRAASYLLAAARARAGADAIDKRPSRALQDSASGLPAPTLAQAA